MISEQELYEAVVAYKHNGNNKTRAAEALGISRGKMRARIKKARKRNMLAEFEGPEVPEGYLIEKDTIQVRDGEVVQAWVRRKRDADITEAAVDALKDTFDQYKGGSALSKPPAYADGDLATVYVIGDHHLGMYAWAKEAGVDYDVNIAKQLLERTALQLVSITPKSEVGIVLNLGDFFHADTDAARTSKSQNQLDTDTRHYKILQTGVQLMMKVIDLAKQKHKRVIVKNIQGNHDEYATLALTVALSTFYDNDPRVTIDMDDPKFFWFQWGKVFLASSHGDKVKAENMPNVMAAYKPRIWGDTSYRYALMGHVHSRKRGGGEEFGAVWESFQTLAGKDAWHRGMGYASGRSMTAITYHKDQGELTRNLVNIEGPK